METLATHAHIATGHDEAKFGVALVDLPEALDLVLASPHLTLSGLSTHIGSQLTRTSPYLAAASALFEIALRVRARAGSDLAFVDTGGGFGVDYGEGCGATPADFVRETRAQKASAGLSDLALHVEPGRALVAKHGVLLASVIQTKVTPRSSGVAAARQRWLMIDAGMNDLIRPALYQAKHRVAVVDAGASGQDIPWRVVGPVCESSDDFGVHLLPVASPRLVALLDVGAYGYTMASRYNGRELPAEVFVRSGHVVAASARAGDDDWVADRSGLC